MNVSCTLVNFNFDLMTDVLYVYASIMPHYNIS